MIANETGLRISDQTPKAIVELFQFPYSFFSEMMEGKYGKECIAMDISCGNNQQRGLLEARFAKVLSYDVFDDPELKILRGDVRAIDLPDKSVDISFCLETLEHLDNSDEWVASIKELIRVTRKAVVVGSINSSGPDYYRGEVIFKQRNGLNPNHFSETDSKTFASLIETSVNEIPTDLSFYQTCQLGDGVDIDVGLTEKRGISNFAVIRMQ